MSFDTLQTLACTLFLSVNYFLLVYVIFYAYYKTRDKENRSLGILYLIIICVVVFAADILFQRLFQVIVLKDNQFAKNVDCYKDIYVIITRFFELLLVQVAAVIIQKNKDVHLDSYECIGSFLLPFFSVIFIYTLSYFFPEKFSSMSLGLFIFSILLIMILNLYFTWFFEAMHKANGLENERRLYEEQARLQHSYYEELKIKYQESRKIIHDIRAHIQTLEQVYLSKNDQAAMSYTKDLSSMLNCLSETYYTDHKVLNIILNDKVHRMKSLDIEEDIRLGEINLDFIKEMDMTTLFSNLLDNAIAAASSADKKFIRLRMEQFNDMISVHIENSYKGPIMPANKGFKSTKENHEGLGLKNIERVVKKYEGDIKYEYTQDTFMVYVMFPVN